MIRTQLYLTEDLYYRIQLEAKRVKKKAAEVVRELLLAGLRQNQTNAGKALMDIVKIGAKGPKDLSSRIDAYLYTQ